MDRGSLTVLVALGGVLVLGLIGVAVDLYLGRREERERQERRKQ